MDNFRNNNRGYNNNNPYDNNYYNNNDTDDSFFNNNDQNNNSDNVFNSSMFDSNPNDNNSASGNMFNDISNQNYSTDYNAQNTNFDGQNWANPNINQQPRSNFGANQQSRNNFNLNQQQRNSFGVNQQPRSSFNANQQPRSNFGANQQPRHNFNMGQPPTPNQNFQAPRQQMPSFDNNFNYNQQNNMYETPPQGDEGIEIEYNMNSNNNYSNNDNSNNFRKAYSDAKQRENFSGLDEIDLFDDDGEKEDELKRAALSYRNKSMMLKILSKGLILLMLLGVAILIYFTATYFVSSNKVSDVEGINDILSEEAKYKTEYKEKLDKEDFTFLKDNEEQKIKDEDKPARKLQSRFMVKEEETQNKSVKTTDSESIKDILGKEDFTTPTATKTPKPKVTKPKTTQPKTSIQAKQKTVNKTKVAATKAKSTKATTASKSVPKKVTAKTKSTPAKASSIASVNNGYWQVQIYSATDLKQTQQKWRDLRTEYKLFDNIEGHPVAASVKGKVYYRLRVGPRKVDQLNPSKKVGYFSNKKEAVKFCVNLKENGIDCFVTLTNQEQL